MEKIEKNNKSVGSSSITLRFRNDILNKLKHEAMQKRISLNTLATQVFSTHAEYDAYASTIRHDLNPQVFANSIDE